MSKGLPKFNDARGGVASALQSAPPFGFKDTSMCVFPIRANTSRLQSFIDQYLNKDNDSVRFEVFIPYLYFMVIDYGKMSIEAANMGWVSQHEVAFGVPLRWMVKVKGEWVFHDWAFHCPFIYVDNELSMQTGREVYGWPKTLVNIDPKGSDWIKDPNGQQQVFEISAKVFEEAYKGEEVGFRPFIQVVHDASPGFLDLPFSPRGFAEPFMRMPEMMMEATRFSVDVASMFAGTMLQGFTGSSSFPNLLDVDVLKKIAKGGVDWLNPSSWEPGVRSMLWSLYPRLAANTVNLKQFRDACHPWLACYQALNNSQMGVESINAGGALGPQNMLFGQFDGGYSIDIHRYGNQAVTDALGLEVARTRTVGNRTIETVIPTFPYWIQVDMSYGRGQTISSRSGKSKTWHINPDFELAESLAESEGQPGISPDHVAAGETRKVYNTARGNALQELAGPFELPNTTLRVLPLLADGQKLDEFVSSYLRIEGQSRVSAWGNYVYLVATNYKLASPEANNVGLFPGRDVQFLVPIRRFDWYEDSEYDLSNESEVERRDSEKFVGVGYVTAFSYVDDPVVAITASEVNGVPTLHSDVASPHHTWMDSSGPAEWVGQRLLDTSALVLPAVGVGAGGSHEKFLEVNTHELFPPSAEIEWRDLVDKWGAVLSEDLEQKHGERKRRREQSSKSKEFERLRGWALKLLTGDLAIDGYSFKQFRDSWEPNLACYQALVKRQMKLEQVYEINEIEDPLHVHLKRYPTQPVVELLGLKVKERRSGSDIDVLEAIRPFWLRADLKQDLAETLYERSVSEQWEVVHAEEMDRAAEVPLIFQDAVLNHLDRVYVPDLRAYLDAQSVTSLATNVADAGADTRCVQPATILDAILSRQWLREKSRRRKIHKPDFCVNALGFGPYSEKLFPELEQQSGFWPQSADHAQERDNLREGLAMQLWRDVWRIVNGAHFNRYGTVGLGAASQPTDAPNFGAFAESFLPNYFHFSENMSEIEFQWSGDQWREIALGLRRLVDNSHNKVNWEPELRALQNWRYQAEEFALDVDREAKPNAALGAGKSESPGVVLEGRIRAFARD